MTERMPGRRPMGQAAAAALACISLLAIACDGGAPATQSPGSSQPAAASSLPTATADAVPTLAPTGVPATDGPVPATEAPTQPASTSGTSTTPPGSPAGTPKPTVESLKAPRTASCTSDNGTGTVGSIRLSWTAIGTSGVRLSIDPPSPDVAYDYPFADYAATGSADVPFSCDPANHDANGDYHLYVVTTIHDGGYYAYRYARVYQGT